MPRSISSGIKRRPNSVFCLLLALRCELRCGYSRKHIPGRFEAVKIEPKLLNFHPDSHPCRFELRHERHGIAKRAGTYPGRRRSRGKTPGNLLKPNKIALIRSAPDRGDESPAWTQNPRNLPGSRKAI